MKWNKFRLKTTTEAEDIIISMLMDLGIQGVEVEDKVPLTQSDKEQMFVDILPETGTDDGVAYLSFYLEPEDAESFDFDEAIDRLTKIFGIASISRALAATAWTWRRLSPVTR